MKKAILPLALCVAVTLVTGAAMGAAGSSTVDPTALPLGDYKYSTSDARRGYIYTCRAPMGQGGAGVDGPWIHGTTYDRTSKAVVDGSVSWPQAHVSIRRSGANRMVTGDGLPTNHTTGIYPIQPSDDAYQYDRNPNSIKEQSVTYTLPANPKVGAPQCIGGEVGIAKNGVKIFDGFDAGGRDANAHEIQDHCGGHPERTGTYHYHSIPSCLYMGQSKSKHSGLVGYAYDGFGIYGPRGNDGKLLTDDDLDVCHGHTHKVWFNGRFQRIYHYHATAEFPYTVGCFRGTKIASNVPR